MRPPQTPPLKRTKATCDDCFFRRAGLCAIPGNAPCPTFRAASGGTLSPPPQPRLVPRQAPGVAVAHAAA
jgi:hypothetical protein